MTTKLSAATSARSRKRRGGRVVTALVGVVIAVTGLVGVYLTALWPWMRRWGATDEELQAALPGDEMVPNANLRTTKAVTVKARPEAVYPWLLQIGVDRGGMYSYDRLENLFGLKVRTVNEIVPAYQNVQIGDFWRFTPAEYVLNPGPGLYVRGLEENRAVLLCFGLESKPDEKCFMTWQWVLEPQGDGTTRLLLRSNAAIPQEMAIKLTYWVQFIMERKMLLTLREKAEQ